MLYQVRLAKKSPILSGRTGMQASKFIKKGDMEIPAGQYTGTVLPKVFKMYTPAFDKEANKYMFNISQEELDSIVQDMQVYDEAGVQITKAPMHSPGAPFWGTNAAYLRLEGGEGTLDDTTPVGRFWLAAMAADRRVHVRTDKDVREAGKGGFSAPIPAMAQFLAEPFTSDKDQQQARISAQREAGRLLDTMTFERKLAILTAMGVTVSKNPDPDAVTNALFQKITTMADMPWNGVRGETNLAIFRRLAESDSGEVVARELFTKAFKQKNIITKSRNGTYMFNDMALGRSVQEVVEKLMRKDMGDVLDDIRRLVDQ